MIRDERINLFRLYARKRWGHSVGKISLDIGERCPNRDRGGCIYCGPGSFSPYYIEKDASISDQIQQGKKYLKRLGVTYYLACFQQETSTVGSTDCLIEKFLQPLSDPLCMGITISTRPDCLYEDLLEKFSNILESYADKLFLIELGLQSIHERSLLFLNRNHTLKDFDQATDLLQKYPRFAVGVHLILGIPGENLSGMQQTIQYVCQRGFSHLKIHHLQVVKGTPLQEHYLMEPFYMPGPDEYIQWLGELLPWIPRHVIIHRLWSTCKPSMLFQPRWQLESNRLYDRLYDYLENKDIYQGQNLIL